jgi:hypothetical protein
VTAAVAIFGCTRRAGHLRAQGGDQRRDLIAACDGGQRVEVASILPQTASIAARRAFESSSFWGEAGRHARAALGVAALPLDTPVVVEATVEVST